MNEQMNEWLVLTQEGVVGQLLSEPWLCAWHGPRPWGSAVDKTNSLASWSL